MVLLMRFCEKLTRSLQWDEAIDDVHVKNRVRRDVNVLYLHPLTVSISAGIYFFLLLPSPFHLHTRTTSGVETPDDLLLSRMPRS